MADAWDHRPRWAVAQQAAGRGLVVAVGPVHVGRRGRGGLGSLGGGVGSRKGGVADGVQLVAYLA